MIFVSQNGICEFRSSDVGATDVGYTDIPRESENALQSAVATVGPISVAIDASRPTFHFYKSGVYYDAQCNSTRLDHGVLAVGYGSDARQDYWIVKNRSVVPVVVVVVEELVEVVVLLTIEFAVIKVVRTVIVGAAIAIVVVIVVVVLAAAAADAAAAEFQQQQQ